MPEPKTKETFGSAQIAVLHPAPVEGWPQSLNVVISFEEALKLHLAIGEALSKLNSYNRATKEGQRTALNLCCHLDAKRATVQLGKLPKA